MFDIRDLRLLSALARHRHFGRAAAECGISQPAFSMRIRNLEERTGTPIVRRGNRFQGLTDEGEAIVRHARVILDEVRTLEEEVRATKGQLSGALRLGAVPTAAAYSARLTGRLKQMYPGIVVRIETASSLAIQTGIDEGTMDAGITYGDGVASDLMAVQELYDERYVLLSPERLAPRRRGSVTWAEAAALPLSLLEPGMQNRRILDATFAEVGAVPEVISETNALTTVLVLARDGLAATVIPATLMETVGAPAGTVVLDLVEPALRKRIVLVSAARSPALPAVTALKHAAADLHNQE